MVKSMKTIIILYNRLKGYFLNNKTVFILFVIGGILNAIMLSFFYGNMLSFKKNEHSTASFYRKYTVTLDRSLTEDQLAAIETSELIENYILGFPIPGSQNILYGVKNENLNTTIRYGNDNLSNDKLSFRQEIPT